MKQLMDKTPTDSVADLVARNVFASEISTRVGLFQSIPGRGVLVVRSPLWGRRVPGSKPDSNDDPPCMGHVERQIILSSQTSARWCGSLEGGRQLRCRPRHLTAVQNYEVCPKIALVLPQNWTLM
ncbi:hypothetical protein AVEN_163487-1 [Araneus ventricosus]|uniref:Uncharacterized protein n=1 Tax=Araneus ventricosus TaxID=182803 RepID=A0A4Y2BS69_ARAVE|nr:hypothetical protein AVEN_163487-1 [Araneus ventricosus]